MWRYSSVAVFRLKCSPKWHITSAGVKIVWGRANRISVILKTVKQRCFITRKTGNIDLRWTLKRIRNTNMVTWMGISFPSVQLGCSSSHIAPDDCSVLY